MSSQDPQTNRPDLFPKADPPPAVPVEDQYKKTDQELVAWDQFFSKMTRKITKPPVVLPPSVPPPLPTNSEGPPPPLTSVPPKPTLSLKPKTEQLSPKGQEKPITSRFRIKTPTVPSSGPSLPFSNPSKPVTSLIKPNPNLAGNLNLASTAPVSPIPGLVPSKASTNSGSLNLLSSENTASSKKEPSRSSEETKPKLKSLIQGVTKESALSKPAEPLVSVKSVPTPFTEPVTGGTPIETTLTPENKGNLFSKVQDVGFPRPLEFQPLESQPLIEKNSLPFEKITTSALLEQNLFRAKSTDAAHLKCCCVCTQMMPPSKVFICERCEEFSCLRHRKGLFWCETCFFKVNQFHPFYERIAETLKQNMVKTKSESSGAVTLDEMISIFKTFSLSVSSQGLLVIGNIHMKRGICFNQQDIFFISFGTNNIISIGKLLVQNRVLTENEIAQAIEFQKQRQMKLGDALIALQMISEQVLQVLLNEQAFREVLAISRWPESNYKFRPGQVPEDLLTKMQIDTAVVLQDPPEFKNALMSIFHHMRFILEPGFLLLTSCHGNIGFLVYKSQIVLANFQGEISFGEYLFQQKRISEEYWNKIKEMPLSLEEYLSRDKIFTIAQINQYRQDYVGQELKKFLQDPEYRCHFYEGEATESDLKNVSILVLGLHLEDLLYDIWPRVPRVPPVATSEDIFTFIFDKNTPDKMIEAIHLQLHQLLECFEETLRLNEFEKSFLKLALIKSTVLNDIRCLEQQGTLLREQKLMQEAGWIGECIQKLSK